jgi:hypothetical protein
MPALFSFLGGIANGYNASKAAEAKALQEEKLEDKRFEGRMEIAKFEARAAQERTVAQAMITNLIQAMLNEKSSEEMRTNAGTSLQEFLSRYPTYRAFANETLNQQSMGGAEQKLPEDVDRPSDTGLNRLEVP